MSMTAHDLPTALIRAVVVAYRQGMPPRAMARVLKTDEQRLSAAICGEMQV